MRTKVYWITGVLLVAFTVGGFFLGRYFAIKRATNYFSRKFPGEFPSQDAKAYHRKMNRLRELAIRERKNILEAMESGSMDDIRTHVDSISEIKKKIMLETFRKLHQISRTLPPSMRKSFLEHRLNRLERRTDSPQPGRKGRFNR